MTSSTSFRLCPLFAHPFRSKSFKKNDLQGINWQSKSLRFLHWNRHHEKPGSLWLQQRGRKKMSKSGSYLWHFQPRLNSPAFSIDVSSAINLVRSAAGRNSVLVFCIYFIITTVTSHFPADVIYYLRNQRHQNAFIHRYGFLEGSGATRRN